MSLASAGFKTAAAWEIAPLTIIAAAAGLSRSDWANWAAVVPSLASSGRASGRSKAAARASKTSPRPSPGRRTARRQRPTPSITPGRERAGSTPARIERRLAAAAHAQHEEEGPARFRLALEAVDHLADGLGAAEEDRLVLEVEVLQAAEGGALQPGRRQGDAVFRRDARGRQAAIDQLPQVVFDVLLEIVGPLEGMKGGDQGPFLVGEPFVEECFQGLDLAEGLGAPPLVAQVGEGLGRLAIDQQIGKPLSVFALRSLPRTRIPCR